MSNGFDATRPLFKYTKRRYVGEMIRDGKLHIGTLHDYRRVEEYGGAVGDVYEGTSEIVEHIERAEWPELQQHPLAGRMISAPPDAKLTVTNTTITSYQDSPDLYVYCLTSTPTAEGLLEFDNDACVRIEDPIAFFRIVTEELDRRGLIKYGHLDACVYGDRQRNWEESQRVHPVFLKSPEFDYQAEVRAVWEPTSRPLPPFVEIECPAATKYLSVHEIPGTTEPRRASRHALRLSDEELLRHTCDVVDELVQLHTELRGRVETREPWEATKYLHPRPGEAGEEHADRLEALWRAALDEANTRLNSGLRRTIAELVREYANRGLRDRRIERALIGGQTLHGHMELGSTLQRLGELLEIRLARATGRSLRLETATSYRFWRGLREHASHLPPAEPWGTELLERLILRAHAEGRVVPLAPDDPSLGSERRTDAVEFQLSRAARAALASLVRAGGSPPSEVLDPLVREQWSERGTQFRQ